MGQLLTIQQAHERLAISKRSLRRLISTGELPAYRVGSLPQAVRIDSDDLDTLCRPITAAERRAHYEARRA